MNQKILITGNLGYIGSILTPRLISEGYEVVGLDSGYFEECILGDRNLSYQITQINKDLREVNKEDLKDVEAVIHLAALSNDPIGNLNSEWTSEINTKATFELAKLAKESGVQRFLFSSSCIIYGMSDQDIVDENTPVYPQTDYAKSKVEAEKLILSLTSSEFAPVSLRNGTIYGLSHHMRFDTVVNDFIGSAVAFGKVSVKGDGKPWRPVLHVEDIARSFQMILESPVEKIRGQIFNNGTDIMNKQILDLADLVCTIVPYAKLEVLNNNDQDQRTYKASFDKFEKTFPDFKFKYSPEKGIKRLFQDFIDLNIGVEEYQCPNYIRLEWLSYLLKNKHLDKSLKWIGRKL